LHQGSDAEVVGAAGAKAVLTALPIGRRREMARTIKKSRVHTRLFLLMGLLFLKC
jgi:hypothetical protein